MTPRLRIDTDAGVVSGGDDLGAIGDRPVEQRRKLQVAVAVSAWDRRATRDVLTDEIRNDRPLELALEVDDVVRDVQAPGHAAGVMEIIEAAAAAISRLAITLVVELHRQTNNLVAGFREKRCGHRRVDTARHGDNYAHGPWLLVAGWWLVEIHRLATAERLRNFETIRGSIEMT